MHARDTKVSLATLNAQRAKEKQMRGFIVVLTVWFAVFTYEAAKAGCWVDSNNYTQCDSGKTTEADNYDSFTGRSN